MPRSRVPTAALLTLAGLIIPCACKKQELPQRRFYDEQIQPILTSFCVGNTSPCHKVDPETNTALGNLDLTSFDAVNKRRDVLRTYGSYPHPLLLLKSLPEDSLLIPYGGKFLTAEIRHAGGKILTPGTDAFFQLKRWLDNGATRDGLPPAPAQGHGEGPCTPTPPGGGPTVTIDRSTAAYQEYVKVVEPFLHGSCAYGTCHSAVQSDFFISCGANDEQIDANFEHVAGFVIPAPASVEQSEFLLRPLDPRAGGASHTGGIFFASRDDDVWQKLRDWAAEVQKSPPPRAPRTPGETFFGDNVMPLLLKRGCALEGCHSPNGFNDFRLRPGAAGFLSPLALRRNYEASLHEFMSLDTNDVRQSRLVKKNVLVARGGILHRGGPLLEGPGPDSMAPCTSPYDAATASAFCTLKEWHRLERAAQGNAVSPLDRGAVVPLAYVSRPPNADSLLEFDTFRGGADLKLADAHLGDDGRIESVDGAKSALGPCAGLSGPDLDVRGPEWSYDGARLVFAARVGAQAGLDLWVLDVAADTCRRLSTDNGRREGDVRVHNFDPVFAPDGHVVFASTRAGTFTLKRFLPNADLYRVAPDLNFAADKIERMTWLLNSELGPAFMQNGQVTFTAEKASPDFYQLSGRRINWDLTDYHPLLSQRSQSDDTFGNTKPSVGYQQATEIREGLDRNFIMILSDATARGAGGALVTFNRSIGPFEEGRGEVNFARSLTIVDPGATGRAGTQGVYRSPFALPNGELLASYAANVNDPANATPQYDLVAVNPQTGARRSLVSGGGSSLVEGALGYRRAGRLLFRNIPQLVFGGHGGTSGDAIMHFPDLPMLATLLGFNLRRGRNIDAFDGATALRVYEPHPPSSATPDPGAVAGSEHVFTQRTSLGSAPLESDGSLRVSMPSGKALILELVDKSGKALFTMGEEHQLGPGETISPGVSRKLFNGVCGGCHGSITGKELDVAVTPDALTGASVSLSRDQPAKTLN